MPNFKIVTNLENIPQLSNNWSDSTKFNSKGRIVDKNGKLPLSDYEGRKYRLISKKERTFSGGERIQRGFLGTVAVAFTLGLALLSKSVRNLFTKKKESIRFGVSVDSSENTKPQNLFALKLIKTKKERVKKTQEEEKEKLEIARNKALEESKEIKSQRIRQEDIEKKLDGLKNILEVVEISCPLINKENTLGITIDHDTFDEIKNALSKELKIKELEIFEKAITYLDKSLDVTTKKFDSELNKFIEAGKVLPRRTPQYREGKEVPSEVIETWKKVKETITELHKNHSKMKDSPHFFRSYFENRDTNSNLRQGLLIGDPLYNKINRIITLYDIRHSAVMHRKEYGLIKKI